MFALPGFLLEMNTAPKIARRVTEITGQLDADM
jgi:hypothetical protein